MALNPESRARFNLSRASILLYDPTSMGMSILGQLISGLGAKEIKRCSTVDDAKEVVAKFEMHLMIIDGSSGQGEGLDFVRWLRREAQEPNMYTPVILTTGHTRISEVLRSRDCGTHFTVAKPLSPIVMLERIIWVAKEGRPFLFTDDYVGPDRRFRDDETNLHRRRREDRVVAPESDVAETASEAVGAGSTGDGG